MTNTGEASTRTTRVFAWTAVEEQVLRRLLHAALLDQGEAAETQKLQQLPHKLLVRNARKILGRPPGKQRMAGERVVDYLRTAWLRAQHRSVIDSVVARLSVGLQQQAPQELRARLKWIKERNRSKSLSLALRAAFVARYKEPRPTRSRPAAIGNGTTTSAIVLRGKRELGRELYDHQMRTHEALDGWLRRRPRGALVVLPTGAGKTTTIVTWLLDWLTGSKGRRILWLAHQRELVDQAAREFDRAAASRPPAFRRRLRVIHGAGSAASTLTDPELAVAVATMQSVRPNESPNRARALRRFASGPTIVVVDEAHRATSPTYVQLLDLLEGAGDVRVLGLTATPRPSGALARRRMQGRFPEELIAVGPEQLVQTGILARPVFHKIDTHVSLEMSLIDARRALNVDIPDVVLRQLAVPVRNRILVDSWIRDREAWGRTLVFATSIAHADDLAALFTDHGVDARALHSASPETAGEVLAWFRTAPGNTVLVSVGMLTEGVDLPEAQTAFLARPTTSAVLMRQMIGRVLRGPRSRGTDIAHLVTLHDDWASFTGIVEPIDLKDLPDAVHGDDSDHVTRPIAVITQGDSAIPTAVLEQVRRLYSDHAALASQGAFVSRADLVGYFETAEMRVPVFEHQQDSFDRLFAALLAGASMQGRPPVRFFDDDPLPHPSERHLAELVREVRESVSRPRFIDYRLTTTPDRTAAAVLAAGALTEDERSARIVDAWNTGGNLSYPTAEHWREAVDLRVRELMRTRSNHVTACDPEAAAQPIKARFVPRDLDALFAGTLSMARELLDSQDTKARLARPPRLRWSKHALRSVHAHWRIAKGGPLITVNTSLQVARAHVSDEVLRYLLWHELLHHVLPGHGHDAEFRMLEARWPNALDLDRELDTMHESITAPKHRS